ncbi:MAG: hypothetical protein ABJD68_04030 [Nakamurella sp.]
MKQYESPENPAERELFEIIKQTYAVVLEAEQQAMRTQLRDHLKTIPAAERMALIDHIETSIGQNLDGPEFEL